MAYYYESKEDALEAGRRYEEYWDVRASLEPYNGWVMVLSPKTMDVFQWPLEPLLAHAELDLTGVRLLARRPPEYVRPDPIPVKQAKESKARRPRTYTPRPSTPAQKKPWEV